MAPIALTPPGLEEPSPEPATGAHGTALPTPMPGGLAEAVRGELAAAARDAAAERLEELGPILGPAREAVLRDVDLRVDERVGELWTKAKQMFGAMQQKHSSQSKALVEEVTRCQANCEALEAENVQLKQALHDLLQRFAQLGKVFHSTDGLLSMPMCPPAPAAAKTPPTKPQAPPVQTAAHNAAEAAAFKEAIGLLSPQPPGLDFPGTLAPVPAFPMSSVSTSESLGGNLTPCGSKFRTPVSLVGALTPMQTPSSTTPPGLGLPMPLMQGKDGFGSVPGTGHFNFTLRKANGADLGLNVITIEHQRVLRVESVRAGGAVDAWNRQCAGGSCADKVVHPGDLVINVNGVSFDPPKMLQECRDKQLLRLTILRRDPILCGPPFVPMPAKAKGSPSERTAAAGLRADASVFVPTPN